MQERYRRVHLFNRIPILYPAIFYDDCSGTYRYQNTGDGADFSSEYLTSAAFIGTNGIQMRTRTTNPAADDYVTLSKTLHLPPSKLIRLQLSAMNPLTSPNLHLIASLHWYDGTNVYMCRIRLTMADEKVYYCSGWAPVYTDTGLHWYHEAYAWNRLDISANINEGKFHRLTVNEQTLDMSAISLPSTASGLTPHLMFQVSVITAANARATAYFDQFLLTGENP